MRIHQALFPALKGSVKVGSEEALPYEAFNTLVLSSGGNETGASLTASEDNTEFILVSYPSSVLVKGAEPFPAKGGLLPFESWLMT